jgi:iron complex outermembrane receptor protein
VEKLDGSVFLTGNPSFKSEKVDAFEIGWRAQPWTRLSLSASVFLNLYDDLRTLELHSDTEFLPLKWGNQMKGNTYGVEAWAKLQLTRWWRLSPGLRKLQKDLKFKQGASGLVGISQSGDDPEFQALLTSSMDLGPRLTFDATYRHVGALPDPHLDPYDQLSASLDWHLTGRVDLSVTGFNLLKAHHLEYPAPSGESISRSVIAQLRCRFD